MTPAHDPGAGLAPRADRGILRRRRPQLVERLREISPGTAQAPGWIASIPLVGESLDAGWREIASSKAALAKF